MLIKEVFPGIRICGSQYGIMQIVVLCGDGEAVSGTKVASRLRRDWSHVKRALFLGLPDDLDGVGLLQELSLHRWHTTVEILDGQQVRWIDKQATESIVHVETELPRSDRTTEIIFDVRTTLPDTAPDMVAKLEEDLVRAKLAVTVAPVEDSDQKAVFDMLLRNPGWRYSPTLGRGIVKRYA